MGQIFDNHIAKNLMTVADMEDYEERIEVLEEKIAEYTVGKG